LKPLTKDQILTLKKPNRRGRPSTPLTEVYEAAYRRTDFSFNHLKTIVKLLPSLQKHKERSDYAVHTLELFNPENFEPILSALLPSKRIEGAALSDKTYFAESQISIEKAIFASKLLKFAGDYLLQAFNEKEHPNLHNRIQELDNDLRGMVESYNERRKLAKEVEMYKKRVSYHMPMALGQYEKDYAVVCWYCNEYAMGRNKIDAIKKINHAPKCEAPKKIDNENTSEWENWYIFKNPTLLSISWEEREILDKAKRSKS